MATLHLEIYAPPKKGMPYLAVGAIGASLQFVHAAKTREKAAELLAREGDRLEARAQLHAAYGQRQTKD